jgi:Ca-activated chloride channel family protein
MIRVLSSMLVMAVWASAQIRDSQVITVDVDLVNIYFTVSNKHGRLIPGLGRDHFAVYEDDNLQLITNFSRETDVPLTIAFLIDTSGSVRYKLPFEQNAAVEFLHSLLRPGMDRASVVTFDSSIDLRQDYTGDQQLLEQAVTRTRSGGATRLYDALMFLLNGALAAHDSRRAIIVLTDGDDNASRSSPIDVVEAAQRNNVAIYIVSVNSVGIPSEHSARSDSILKMCATETGGRAFFPETLKDLYSYFAAISKELRSQYTIAYRSNNLKRDGAYRKVRIEIRNTHYSVRARSGYYAPAHVAARGAE